MNSMLKDVITIIFIALQALTAIFGAYQIVFSLFGLSYRKHRITTAPSKRFAVLVAAHNEANVLSPLLENLLHLDYPSELYDVYVIADNCTDDTASIARAHGVRVAQRNTVDQHGKGYAIRWMLDRLQAGSRSYDAVVMFDADNLVSENFLRVMNDRLSNGKRVIQGYLDSKNPYDSWVTVSMAISYWYTNRMWQLARRNLGLSCALGGTGLCIDMTLLQELGWDATGLAEDTEFGAKCVGLGIYPEWAHEARIYDEKPVTLRASMRQRLRWMQGHFACAETYASRLIVASVRERNLAKLDAAVYLFQPASFLVIFLTGFMLYWQVTAPSTALFASVAHLLPTWFWILVNLFVVIQMPLAMILERVNWRGFLGLPLFPFFMMTWFPVTLIALFTRHNKTWAHTKHSRALSLHQVRSKP